MGEMSAGEATIMKPGGKLPDAGQESAPTTVVHRGDLPHHEIPRGDYQGTAVISRDELPDGGEATTVQHRGLHAGVASSRVAAGQLKGELPRGGANSTRVYYAGERPNDPGEEDSFLQKVVEKTEEAEQEAEQVEGGLQAISTEVDLKK